MRALTWLMLILLAGCDQPTPDEAAFERCASAIRHFGKASADTPVPRVPNIGTSSYRYDWQHGDGLVLPTRSGDSTAICMFDRSLELLIINGWQVDAGQIAAYEYSHSM